MKGIDISSHQGTINWEAVKSDGVEFAIIRAGYGRSTVDKCFKRNIEEAAKVGIKVGIYWFSYAISTAEAVKEATFCLNCVKDYKLSFPIFYDFEYDTERYAKDNGVTFTAQSRTEIIKTFCDEIEKQGYECGVYTNLDYIKNRLKYDELKKYPLWLALYNSSTEQTTYNEMMRQISSTGKVSGISGNVDMNVCYIEFKKEDKQPESVPSNNSNEVSEWAKEAVEWAVKNNILQGNDAGDYMLKEPCTTERFITLLHRAIKTIKIDIGG